MAESLNDAFRLDGKVAVVTGGASGIGAGIAAVLADSGAIVVIADRDAANAEKQVGVLKAAGHKASAVQIDLTDDESVVRACAEVVSRHGAPWLLVNNAGLQDRQALLDGTTAEWDRIHHVNARGPFLMTREIGRAMVKAGQGGRIVNIGSTAVLGPLIAGLGPYVASKGALVGLSLASAFELVADRITVNTVMPGGVATPGSMGAKGPAPEGPGRRQPPLGRCEPRDIGAAVLFFATPAARYITNQVLAVDAGFSLT